MFETDIVRALNNHLKTMLFAPALPIEFPRVKFATPDGRYLRVKHFPNQNTNLFVGSDDPTMHQGIYQVSLIETEQQGEAAAVEICAAIVAHFAKGTELRDGSAVVKIEEKPSLLSPLESGQNSEFAVSIRYRCYG